MLPLRHLLAYQKLRERIIYETCLAGFRLRSVDVGDTCISQGNSLEEKTDYSRRQERVWILSARLLLISYEILLKCLGFFFPTFFMDSESYAPAAKHKTLLDLLGSFGCHADVTLTPS